MLWRLLLVYDLIRQEKAERALVFRRKDLLAFWGREFESLCISSLLLVILVSSMTFFRKAKSAVVGKGFFSPF